MIVVGGIGSWRDMHIQQKSESRRPKEVSSTALVPPAGPTRRGPGRECRRAEVHVHAFNPPCASLRKLCFKELPLLRFSQSFGV